MRTLNLIILIEKSIMRAGERSGPVGRRGGEEGGIAMGDEHRRAPPLDAYPNTERIQW